MTLGLKLLTRGKTWTSISDEFWRFLLYSEFVFDLPGDLPPALANVPCAPAAAQTLVEDLCDALRRDPRTRPIYIERAERIEREMELPHHCGGIADLGSRDTFPFEERTILAGTVAALKADRLDDVRNTLDRHRHSVWIGKGESQAQWGLVEAALRLVEACDDAERQLVDHGGGLAALMDWYVASLRETDRRQREFEQSAADIVAPEDAMAAVRSPLPRLPSRHRCRLSTSGPTRQESQKRSLGNPSQTPSKAPPPMPSCREAMVMRPATVHVRLRTPIQGRR